MFRSKNYKESAKLIDKQALYDPMEALHPRMLPRPPRPSSTRPSSCTSSSVLTAVTLTSRSAAPSSFPTAPASPCACSASASLSALTRTLEAGADYAGGMELVEKIQKENWFEFDTVIASPDMMGIVGRLGKILGPKGLMPSPQGRHRHPEHQAGHRRSQGR